MLASPWVKALCVAAVALVRATNADAIDDQATQIVNSMTDAQLVGQMAQVNVDEILGATGSVDPEAVRKYAKLGVGSYLNSPFAGGDKNGKYGWTATEWQAAMKVIQDVHKQEGTPPVIYGIDSVHGANYVLGATIFGQQINAGASFNPDLVYKMGQITGRDTLAGGMSWIFGPILEIAQNPLWSRTYETFGEDPYLVSVMGSNIIQGIQNNTGVAACMKHFIGYSKLVTGHDRDPVTLSDFDLLNYFAPPFIAAIKAGVMSGMENYISINGVPTVASAKLMKDLLRKDLGFEGFIVTDWAEIQNLVDYHRVAKTPLDAVRMSLTRTTIDMSMVSYNGGFIDYAKQVLADTPSIKDRIKDSVRRIIKTKLALGLYTTPVPGASLVSKVGQAEDRAVALALAQESIVLLQNNNNVLPLSKTAKVFLTGHSAHNIGNQCGGWSLRWQGYTGNSMYPNGISIKTAMQKASSSVTFYAGDVETGDNMYANTATALQQLQSSGADTVVVVIGEKPYTEKPGDIEELALDAEQVNYVKQLKAANKKVIVVLIGGRPRLLGDIPSVADAIVNAMLPGELGGQAISDILYGDVNPSGRLPLTYQKNPSNVMLPYNRPVTALCKNDPCQPQWAFGTGLSYTKFDYTLQLSKSTVTGSTDSLVATVTVKNSGSRDGKETVMLFISQKFREIAVPELKQLKRFKKISLKAGEQTAVSFTLDASDWSFYDPQIGNGLLRRAEDGDFIVSVKPETTCDVYGNPYSNPLCAKFTLSTVNTVSTDGAGTVVAFNG